MQKIRLAVDGGSPIRTAPFPSWPIVGELEEKLMLEAVRSGNWGGVDPDKIKLFEEQFARLQDANYAVTVNNGTIAISIALLAAGIEAGDEVIMPSYTFIATATAALMIGAIPVFADVDESMLIDPDKVEAAITPSTKAIIAVHIAGAPANMTRLSQIAKTYKLSLIEDAAQAVAAKWEDQGVGALGDLGTFSLQSSKNLNCGEGGVIVSNDEELAEHVWSIHNCGRVRSGKWYQHESIGWNFRFSEVQAALALAQLSRLEDQMEIRQRSAKKLDGLLHGIEGIHPVKYDSRITKHANHLYMFKLDRNISNRNVKEDFIRKLNAEGIPVTAGYVPLNKNSAIIDRIRKLVGEVRTNSCPMAERASEHEMLWLHQNVLLGSEQDMEDIANGINKVIQSYL
ncbi:DegT/DnrJ/EryC1/StrS family aminotransferase [Paenibacillus nasutitermitis]|uniref:3-amino-5-hydroxybenzoate synthase n=1 Tax=Paenibacillus nasutitermitis TaxID=1652958 RepID=A0A916YXT0_9BACL|nr:DegT/DnrJ/EryC1/StrS family aminotransferase [Paenibacillus nasutitermitis]GGD66677.1 3-amino-5-hydroxybenzoate synthase [Paenibacillus nasutitermitis]